MNVRLPIWLWLVTALWLTGCGKGPLPGGSPTPAVTSSRDPKPASGLRFKLSAANPESDAATPMPAVDATPLPKPELEALLHRLPPLQSRQGERKSFALREASQPPPRTARSIAQPFPPPDKPPARPATPQGEPLQVLRIAPRGAVEMAPHLSVTFNQPMVPIATVESLAERDVPVKLTPSPPGKWRWLGTDTLMFVPDVRFPMATEYRVEVPAGVKDANGHSLASAVQEVFKTPPPRLMQSYPQSGPTELRPTVFLAFDQDVDPAQVAQLIHLSADKPAPTLRLATNQEAFENEQIAGMAETAGPRRWVALLPTAELQPGTTYTVEVPAGLKGLEGPLPTTQPQNFSFGTYDPLRIDYKTDKTVPGQVWSVRFNNPLIAEKFKPEWVQVEPELPGLKVQARSYGLMIAGRSRGRTDYRVHLAADIEDAYKQKLGHVETFQVRVGEAPPSFSVDADRFTVLDPQGPPELVCRVTNYKQCKVEVWRVEPEHWADYQHYVREGYSKNPPPVPGRKVMDQLLDTGVEPDLERELKVDLSSALSKGLGQLIVRLEPLPQKGEPWHHTRYVSWVQATHLGLDVASDTDELLGWVNDLASGKPVAGATLTVLPSGKKAETDGSGLARCKPGLESQVLVARKGDDVALLPRDFAYWQTDMASPQGQELWHVLDDRQLYRPGESAHIKGWVRRQQGGPQGDLVMAGESSVSYSLQDSVGNEITKGTAAVGRLGGFAMVLKLPKTMNLGSASLSLTGAHGSTYHSFRVEEFRRPEFEVSLQATPTSSRVGAHAVFTATASYFSGGPLPNAQVHWSAQASQTSFSPPGWDGYTFGSWTPWWDYVMWWDRTSETSANYTQFETRTDPKGRSALRADFLSVDPARPFNLQVEATVQDVNRQSWSSRSSVLVHPASVYVGLKSERTFVEKGQPLKFSVIVTDPDGKAVAGRPVEIRSYRVDWDEFGELRHADEKLQTVTSAAEAVPVELTSTEGGTYRLEARVQDEENRSNSSTLTTWVAGGKARPTTRVQQESVSLVPSKKEYLVGDTAEVLVQAPFAPAELLVTTRREGLAKVERLSAPDGTATLKVPLTDLHIPSLTVQVDAVGSKVRTDEAGEELPGKPMRPAYATGTVSLAVSNRTRKLDVSVKPEQQKLRPGGSTRVRVQVKDFEGKPVQGEVTLFVVDESVLALSGYDPADPLGSFCVARPPGVRDAHLRAFLALRQPETTEITDVGSLSDAESFAGAGAFAAGSVRLDARRSDAPAPSAAPVARTRSLDKVAANAAPEPEAAAQPSFKVRSNFDALAFYASALPLNANGDVSATVKLPDSLTRYRIVALAVHGVKQFGKGEGSLVAQQPLMIRPSAPRFLNFGDHFELPVVVQNQTDDPMTVSLACRGANVAVGEKDRAGYKVRVPANDRVEVRFPCAAADPGTARFQFGASAAKASDAAEVALPVWTPATTEAFATYGVVDQGALSQPVEKPKDVWPQFGGLTVSTSSTALAELTDAFLYLASYPFECSEQVASRMLAAAALQDVLEAFQAPGMASRKDLQAAMKRDLDKLKGLQHDDGGWDYWDRDQESRPYLSVHVAHALVRVKAKGYPVDDEMLSAALRYLGNVEAYLSLPYYSPETRRCIRAYALYVLNRAGQPNVTKARALVQETKLDALGLETMAWLLPTLAHDPQSKKTVSEILRYVDNHSTQTASTAEFTTGYSDQGYLVLYSNRRDDGVMLESLIEVQPKHPLIPKLVRGLLDHRSAGRWENTQENCWVLLALDRYFHQYESVTPDFVASLWLGDRYAGSQTFRGRDKDEKKLEVPMSDLESGPLLLSKQGPGRLYYRIGMNYAPKDLKQAPADYGFAVQRRYEAVGDNRDVRRESDGSWHIKAGAQVKVTLTMGASSRRYHVALVDPLPAGLEAENPALLGTRSAPPQAADNRADGWWSRYWFTHENMRDERVEAFTELLWEGVYTYSYIARATTPGTFVVPPAKAEEMYHPETFGRSASEVVVVE